MASESITFPENKIPIVVRIIRKGLEGETNKEVRFQLLQQCEELEEYWKRLQED